jgi:arylformamidase
MIHEGIAVWPGDTPVSRELLCDISTGSNIDLSTIRSTVHLGAHADAPRHYHQRGKTIDAVDLNKYIGTCIVISALNTKMIEPMHCAIALEKNIKRVLFRTNSFPNPNHFNEDFTAFSPDALDLLGKAGVKLIGIDTPSVDPFHSKDLAAHQVLYKYDIANLEGLVLDSVSDGVYELIALPLKLKGFDASPVRAVLRRL